MRRWAASSSASAPCYGPSIWPRGRSRRMGRFDECWPREERAIRMAREHSAQENLGWALGGSTTFSYLARGASRVPAADLRRIVLGAEDLVDVVGGRYSEMYAAFSLAVGSFMSGDFTASEARFEEALAQACAAGNALEWQSYFLAVFADASLANGNVEAAIARAREAISVADGGGAWFQSALARTALVDALIRAEAPEPEIDPAWPRPGNLGAEERRKLAAAPTSRGRGPSGRPQGPGRPRSGAAGGRIHVPGHGIPGSRRPARAGTGRAALIGRRPATSQKEKGPETLR
jgi:hypothetical protein